MSWPSFAVGVVVGAVLALGLLAATFVIGFLVLYARRWGVPRDNPCT